MRRICVQWPRFGPYHIARLNALHEIGESEQVEVVGLETAGEDRLYGWERQTSETSFRRVQVFSDRVFEDIRPAEMQKGISKALDELQPEAIVINSYSFPDARACLKWCRANRRVAVCATDTKEDAATRIWWREYIKSILVNQFDALLVAGTPHQEYFRKLGFPSEYIYLGCDVVDNEYFRKSAEEARKSPDHYKHLPGLGSPEPYFLSCGRYIPQKNLDGLIQAYAAYRREADRPWRLVLVGDGPGRAELEALITSLDVGGVTLTGFRQFDDLPAYYGLAGAYVHSARNDQWGLVVNEAMASGLPVLVSDATGCVHDLVADGKNGFTFVHDDLEKLSRLLSRVSSDRVDRSEMGRSSRQIITGWSLDVYAKHAWSAIQSGRRRADRGMEPRAAFALWSLDRLSSSVTSFHTVEG